MRRAAAAAVAAASRLAAQRAPAASHAAVFAPAAPACAALRAGGASSLRSFAATPLAPLAPLAAPKPPLPSRGSVWRTLPPRAAPPSGARRASSGVPSPSPPPATPTPPGRVRAGQFVQFVALSPAPVARQPLTPRPRRAQLSVVQSEAASRLRVARASVDGALASLPAVRETASARAEAWWARNAKFAYAAGGVTAAVLIWRLMFGIAARFIDLSETVAEAGFLALALSLVAAGGTAVAWRRRLDPEAVYRLAMRQLKASPTVLRVLGAPLVASETRAFVLSGGGVRLKNWRPQLRSRRCHLLFPLAGSAGRGVVSAEAKKAGGAYTFKLLALDVPGRGGEARVYLAGDAAAYDKGGVLGELRDPLVAALAQAPAQEAEDERDEDTPVPALPLGAAAVEAAVEAPAHAAPAPADAARSGAPPEDPYAWDYLTAWLARKRARQAAEAAKQAAPPK